MNVRPAQHIPQALLEASTRALPVGRESFPSNQISVVCLSACVSHSVNLHRKHNNMEEGRMVSLRKFPTSSFLASESWCYQSDGEHEHTLSKPS